MLQIFKRNRILRFYESFALEVVIGGTYELRTV